ncbi:unnamed protein product, partial [Polarella glacialis]
MDLQLETLGRATGPRCAEQNQRSAPAELEPWWTASVVIDCESSGQEEDDSEVEFVSAGSWTLTAEEGKDAEPLSKRRRLPQATAAATEDDEIALFDECTG